MTELASAGIPKVLTRKLYFLGFIFSWVWDYLTYNTNTRFTSEDKWSYSYMNHSVASTIALNPKVVIKIHYFRPELLIKIVIGQILFSS